MGTCTTTTTTTSAMDVKIFMRVPNIKISDLPNWSESSARCRKVKLSVKNKRREAGGLSVQCNEEQIAVFRYGEKVYAITEKCPHSGGPLHLGDIEDTPSGPCVRCPWHSWLFHLESGECQFPKRLGEKASVYPVRIDPDETLWIGFDKFSQTYFDLSVDF